MRDRLTRLGYTAATLAAVDGIAGLSAHVPFDRIIATPTGGSACDGTARAPPSPNGNRPCALLASPRSHY